MKIKEGSRWSGGGYDKVFVVLAEVETNGNVWIHYRDENRNNKFSTEGCREYSCYKESFLQRFNPLPE